MNAIGFYVDIVTALAENVRIPVSGLLGGVLAGLGALLTAWVVYEKTGSGWDTLGALVSTGIIAALLTIYVGGIVSGIALGAVSIGTALFLIVLLEVLAFAITTLIVECITESFPDCLAEILPLDLRRWLYALLEGGDSATNVLLGTASATEAYGAVA